VYGFRKILVVAGLVLASIVIPATPSWAGSPHFVDDTVTFSVDGNTLTVSGKEAGLGDETQVHIVLTATAQCVNPGGNKPQAANKMSVSAEGDFPVQNGKAYFTLTAVAVFQPSCSPPMSVVFTDIMVADTTHGVSEAL
jgi:hypothetical protein